MSTASPCKRGGKCCVKVTNQLITITAVMWLISMDDLHYHCAQWRMMVCFFILSDGWFFFFFLFFIVGFSFWGKKWGFDNPLRQNWAWWKTHWHMTALSNLSQIITFFLDCLCPKFSKCHCCLLLILALLKNGGLNSYFHPFYICL